MMTRRLLWIVPALLAACGPPHRDAAPSVEFTKVPAADKGGQDALDVVAGRVTGARSGQRIVLFSKSGVWWVQPEARQPFTEIRADSSWTSAVHLGTEYAALVVEGDYSPPLSTETLPEPGGAVAARTIVPGDPSARAPHHTLEFGGYEWIARAAPSDRGGTNDYDPANAWTDDAGRLHLRIAGEAPRWTCAEVRLTRRLGYGTYRFVVGDVSHLEPAVVLSFFTWDGPAADQNHREIGIEISRWGEARANNAKYVVQPYYAAGNVWPFEAQPGILTHALLWEPGRLAAKTVRGAGGSVVAQHAFTSGVPSAGDEMLRMSLYVFRRSAIPLQRGTEVVIEKFEYLP
jgi:hypothetical protein